MPKRQTCFLCLSICLAFGRVQGGETIAITGYEPSGRIRFATTDPGSNHVYGVESSGTLSGEWRLRNESFVAATNAQLMLEITPSTDAREEYYRITSLGYVAGRSQATNVQAVLAVESGERLYRMVASEPTYAYVNSEGQVSFLYLREDGLPDRVVGGGYVVLFANFTSNRVDLAGLTRGLPVWFARGVELGPTGEYDLAMLHSFAGSSRIGKQELEDEVSSLELVRIGKLGLSIAGCAISIATAPTGLIAAVLIPAACGGTLVELGTELGWWEENEHLEAVFDAIDAFECATFPLTLEFDKGLACAELVGGFLEDRLTEAEATQEELREAVLQTRAVLRGEIPLPALGTFEINAGANTTTRRDVTLDHTATGTPTHYQASEDSGFAGAEWLPYTPAPMFVLSLGNGPKTVHFKLRNPAGESAPMSDQIQLDAAAATVIPTASIQVDGDPADWAGLAPVVTDASGDVKSVSGCDLTAIHVAQDGQWVYVRLTVSNPPVSSSLYFGVAFHATSSTQAGDRFVFLNLPYGGCFVDRWTNPSQGRHENVAAGHYAIQGDTIEAAVPLAALSPPRPCYVYGWNDTESKRLESTSKIRVMFP